MTENYYLIVEEEKGHLDKTVAEKLEDLGRTKIKELVDDKNIPVNHKAEEISYEAQADDSVGITVPPARLLSLEAQNLSLDIVYGDVDVIVANKPQGTVVHPPVDHPDHTLINGLLYRIHGLADSSEGFRPGIVYRIDRGASGLLVVAKNDRIRESLEKQLTGKVDRREYLAIVYSNFEAKNGVIGASISRNPNNRERVVVSSKGEAAVTHSTVSEQFRDYSLAKCVLGAGRTHQIGVHMRYTGHPLAGDPLYGPKKALAGHDQFLHIKTSGFYQPFTHRWLKSSAPLPMIFEKQLKNLRREVKH